MVPFLRFPDRFFLLLTFFLELVVALSFGLFLVDFGSDVVTSNFFTLLVLRDRSFFFDRTDPFFTAFLCDRASLIAVGIVFFTV